VSDPNPHADLSDYPCPECGYEGPHPYWPEDQDAECGDCEVEFKVIHRPEYEPGVDECMRGPTAECSDQAQLRVGGFVLCDKHWTDRAQIPATNYPH